MKMELRPLDRTDEEIVRLLQKNARLSNKELAARISLAPSTCLERVRRLEEAGVFRGFHAEINPSSLGIRLMAMISVRLSKHDTELVKLFRDHALTLPEVRDVYHVAGANDFMIHVAVRDAEHLRELLLTSFTGREEVDHLETSLIFEYRRNPVLASCLELK